MPIAHIQLLHGREPALKAALIKSVTAAIVESLNVKPESVRVILEEIHPAHWGIGGVSAEELKR